MIYFFLYYIVLSLSALLPISISNKRFGVVVTLSAFLIFIPYIFITKGVRDIELFESVGFFASKRADIYYIDSNHGLYPYFPLISLALGPLYIISQALSLPFLSIWRFSVLLILVCIVILMKKLILKDKDKEANQKLFIFLLSAPTLFPVFWHGHFDIILIFFYLFSLYLAFFPSNKLLGIIGAGVCFGLSVLTKTWSVIFIPVFLLDNENLFKKKTLFFISTFLTIIFITLFYLRFWHSFAYLISEAVTNYFGASESSFGLSGLINQLGLTFSKTFRQIYLFLLFAIACFFIFIKKHNPLENSKFLMLSIAVFSLGWSIQYIFWVWPFLILTESLKSVRIVSLLALPYIFVSYLSIFLSIDMALSTTLLSLPVWAYLLKLWYTFARK